MTILVMALAGWLVVRAVHALSDAAGEPEPTVQDQQAEDAMVGLAGFEPTTP